METFLACTKCLKTEKKIEKIERLGKKTSLKQEKRCFLFFPACIKTFRACNLNFMAAIPETFNFVFCIPSVCKWNKSGQGSLRPKGFTLLMSLRSFPSLLIMQTAKWQPFQKLIKNHLNRVHLFSTRPVFILCSILHQSKVILMIFALLRDAGPQNFIRYNINP